LDFSSRSFNWRASDQFGYGSLFSQFAELVGISDVEPPVDKDQSAPADDRIEHEPSVSRRHKDHIQHNPYGIDQSVNEYMNTEKSLLVFYMRLTEQLDILIHTSSHRNHFLRKNLAIIKYVLKIYQVLGKYMPIYIIFLILNDLRILSTSYPQEFL
jgi:hypothetical protein